MISIRTRRPGPAPKLEAPAIAATTKKVAAACVPMWRDTENQTLQAAARIAGVSPSSLYRMQSAGTLKFKRICGRVVVTTESLAKLIDGADDWTPSAKGQEARAARRVQEHAA